MDTETSCMADGIANAKCKEREKLQPAEKLDQSKCTSSRV